MNNFKVACTISSTDFVVLVRRYLHEGCQPPVIHRSFKAANVLLDDDLLVRVSDCGLASLIASGAVTQVSHNSTFCLNFNGINS